MILKIAGPIDNFPNVFNSADLDLNNKIQSPIVAPPPPSVITYDQNGWVKKCTIGCPAENAEILAIKYICINGKRIGWVILAPCNPKNQNTWAIMVIKQIPTNESSPEIAGAKTVMIIFGKSCPLKFCTTKERP